MILDERTEFLDANALNLGVAGGYLLGDVMDISPNGAGVVGRDIGVGEPLYFVVTVDTTVTSAGAATASFSLCSDDTPTIVPASCTYHFTSRAFALSEMVAGAVLVAVALPMEGPIYERYLGVVQTTGVAALTAGKINAFLTLDVSKWKALPDAVN